jgi:hypothetical protein
MTLPGIGAASTPLPLGAACAVPQAQIQTELRYSLPSLGMHRALPGPFQHSMNPDMPVNVGDAPEMLPDPVVTSQPNAGTGPDIDDAEGNVSGGWSSGSARALVADGADCAPLRDSSERLQPAMHLLPQPESRRVRAPNVSFPSTRSHQSNGFD